MGIFALSVAQTRTSYTCGVNKSVVIVGAGLAGCLLAVYLARAAVATGIDGLFLEVHPDPECALCDGPNSLYLDSLPALLGTLKKIDGLVKTSER